MTEALATYRFTPYAIAGRLETHGHEGPLCPYCGYPNLAQDDAALYDHTLDTFTCRDCGRDFRVSVLLAVTWVTRPLEAP